MKALAINSSARKDGNTAIFVNCRRFWSGGALNTLDAMTHFFMLQNMFIVGSSYWPMAYGQMPGDVLNDEASPLNELNRDEKHDWY